MLKRLRENRKSKKGFTLVELIVVIVIILILAAVMVPSVIKYVDKANKTNTKEEAASTLIEVQAKVADFYAGNDISKTDAIDSFKTTGGVTVTRNDTMIAAVATGGKTAVYQIAIAADTTTGADVGDVTKFSYQDGKHFVTWTIAGGWADVK